jgi:hypothetical protein
MFIYLNNGTNQNTWSLLAKPSVLLIPADNDELVNNDVPFTINIFNNLTGGN